MQHVLQHAALYGKEEHQELALAMLDYGAGAAPAVGSSIFTIEHRSHGDMPKMSVGADSPVAGLVDEACGPQGTHTRARMIGPSLGEGMPGPLQVAGPDVSC